MVSVSSEWRDNTRRECFYLAALLPPSLPFTGNATPLLALWRREQPAEGNAAHTPWLTLTGLTIVLLAQMKLATVSRRNREKGSAGEEEEEKEAWVQFNAAARDHALICISKSNARPCSNPSNFLTRCKKYRTLRWSALWNTVETRVVFYFISL